MFLTVLATLVGGGRVVVKGRTVGTNLSTGAVTSVTDQKTKIVPYVAAVLNLAQERERICSYTQIYQLSAPHPGTRLGPVTDQNYEAGVKGKLMDGKLIGSLAV